MNERLGVQVTPWCSARELVAVGERLAPHVDTIFLQDQMLARHVYSVLAALATCGCGVGTNVTWPSGRNPIEMASAAATISELLEPGRTLTLGIGSGGALTAALLDMSNRAAVVGETIALMRALWRGDDVALDTYPLLGSRLGYAPGAVATLTYPVPDPPQVLLAGVGPRIMRIAAAHADGSICASNLPPHSRAALEAGLDADVSAVLHDRARTDPSFRMHYGMNVSVSADRVRARSHACRQAALIVGNPSMWPAMERIGLDVASAQAVKDAFDAGLGVDGASRHVSADLADALIVAGTPDDVIGPLGELHELAKAHGYTDFFLGGPLGPDPAEAAELLRSAVIPAIWPERSAP